MRLSALLIAVLVVVGAAAGSANADSIISRMLSRVWPSNDSADIDTLLKAAAANDESATGNEVPTTAPAQQSWSTIGAEGNGADTAGWNPFTWFAKKLRSIPYNPDSDLQTVSSSFWGVRSSAPKICVPSDPNQMLDTIHRMYVCAVCVCVCVY